MMDCAEGEEATVKSNSNHNYAAGTDGDSLLQQQNHVVEMNNLLNAYANNGAGGGGGGSSGSGETEFLMNDVEMENGNGHAVSNSSNGKCERFNDWSDR